MSKALKTILIIGVVMFAGLLFLVFRPDEMCGNRLAVSELSPNKELKALIFSVDCGAAGGFSTQISIVDADYKFKKSDKGNVFRADDDHGKAKMNGDIIDLQVKWINDKTLLIAYDKNARIFKDKTSKKGVIITYMPIN